MQKLRAVLDPDDPKVSQTDFLYKYAYTLKEDGFVEVDVEQMLVFDEIRVRLMKTMKMSRVD